MATSSLDLLQFQPIRFGFTPETCANNDNRDYCNLVQDGDSISWQIRRTVGTPLACDWSEIDSTNLTNNPEFIGSSVPWTLGGGWSWDAGDFIKIAGGTGTVTNGFLIDIVDDRIYQMVVSTKITTTGDDLDVYLSGVLIGSIPVNAPAGNYYFYGIGQTATPTISISGTGITTQVESIYLYRAAPCFLIDVVTGTFNYDPINGFSINGTTNITVDLAFETSSIYSPKTTLQISGYQAGTIEVGYDSDFSGAQTGSNGQFNWTNNGSNNTVLAISFIDFIGNITDISFQQLSSDYYFSLNDLDGVFIQSLNTYITYCRDYIIGSFDPQAEGFSYGCYKIGLYDPFLHDDKIEFYYDFTTLVVPFTQTGTVWTLTGGTGYEFDPGSAVGKIKTNETASAQFGAAFLKLKFETGDINTVAGRVESVLIDENNATGILSWSPAGLSDDTEYEYVTEGYPPTIYDTLIDFHMNIYGTIGGEHFEIKNTSFVIYPYHRDYLSNCFSYSESIQCTKMIYANAHNNLGFNMDNCPFAIQQRFRIVRITPHYKIAATDFIGSDGTRVLVSGTMQKFYTLMFDYMGEVAHDVVAAILMSKEIYIYDTLAGITTLGTRYFAVPQDYTPEWEKDGKLNLAIGRIEIMEYNQVKTVTNCE